VHRGLPAGRHLTEVAYADPTGPLLIDWVNYSARMASASPLAFARRLEALRPAGGAVFVVEQNGYRTLGNACPQIVVDLSAALGPPIGVLSPDLSVGEHASLLEFGASRG
jgi:hypothetical protein